MLAQAGNHRSALTTLARDLNDAASAEAYCNLQGEFIPPKVAVSVAEATGLSQWVEGLSFGIQPTARQRAQSIPQPPPKDETKSRELIKLLLEVYMSDECVCSTFFFCVSECLMYRPSGHHQVQNGLRSFLVRRL
jgi:hypothetical protein